MFGSWEPASTEGGDRLGLAGGPGAATEPYLGRLGNNKRSLMCPAYIAGLIGTGDRKSLKLIADRLDHVAYTVCIISLGRVFGASRR